MSSQTGYRWFQFSLKWLFAFVSLFCVALFVWRQPRLTVEPIMPHETGFVRGSFVDFRNNPAPPVAVTASRFRNGNWVTYSMATLIAERDRFGRYSFECKLPPPGGPPSGRWEPDTYRVQMRFGIE